MPFAWFDPGYTLVKKKKKNKQQLLFKFLCKKIATNCLILNPNETCGLPPAEQSDSIKNKNSSEDAAGTWGHWSDFVAGRGKN